ncbi:MAG: hypothetical protein ABIA02_02340 [Candidatus Falkowbacteria bacterium]
MEWLSTLLEFINPAKIIGFFKRPKLEIYYDEKETYHKVPDLTYNGILGNFGHVMVRNTGKTVAKNCVGKLRLIELYKDNKFQAVPEYRNVMDLKWAHEEDFYPKDIEPDDNIRLDLCYVHDGHNIIHFFTKKYPGGNQTDFLPGLYKVKIKVNSDNAKSIEKYFKVEYKSGDFNSFKIDDIKI